jgi:hypothetical protein
MTTAEKVSQMIVFAATSFPMPINLGATFNRSLVYRMGSVISTEARAFNNEGRTGLDFFTPNINIFRDPRWGRGQETPGEDPFLTSEYVYALIDGLQRGDDDRYLKIAADCKHYAAYDSTLFFVIKILLKHIYHLLKLVYVMQKLPVLCVVICRYFPLHTITCYYMPIHQLEPLGC